VKKNRLEIEGLWFESGFPSEGGEHEKANVGLFLMVFWVGLGFSGSGQCAEMPKVIHVGNAGAFTGDAAAPCMEIFNSAQIAVDEWNAKGGIQGIKIEQIMGDDAMDPAQAVNAAQKFCTDELMYGVIGPP
jgi:branched-chain amino acid transport system substrate-binding protein